MQWLIDIVKEWLLSYFKGMIVLWSKSSATIPDGWHLCDGTNGTPDLRDKFVMGAGSHYDPGETGGADSHTHDFTADSHYHWLGDGEDIAEGMDYSENTNPVDVTGTTDPANNIPAYYALCYIMKL